MSSQLTSNAQRNLEALAESLTASADVLHARLLQAMNQHASASEQPAITREAAQALFEAEVILRQRAMALYLEAAILAGGGLVEMLDKLLDVTAKAQEKIGKIDKIMDLIALVGELASMAAAVATGAPEKLVAPYQKLKQRVESLS